MAHSAYPELGESAVHKLVQVLAKLLKLELPVTEDMGPSTLNIGQIHGGHAPNVIADKAEAQVLVRLVGDSAPVKAALLEAAEGLAEVDFTLEIPFVRLRAPEGLPTMVAKFTTDIPQLSNWGEPLLLGPGSIHVAHTPFEKLAKKELAGGGGTVRQGGEAAACVAGLRRSPACNYLVAGGLAGCCVVGGPAGDCLVNSNVQVRPTIPRPWLLVPVPVVSWNWALMS